MSFPRQELPRNYVPTPATPLLGGTSNSGTIISGGIVVGAGDRATLLGGGGSGGLYPRVAHPVGTSAAVVAPPPSYSRSGESFIKVVLRPEYHLTPMPAVMQPALPAPVEFSKAFDFDFERDFVSQEERGEGAASTAGATAAAVAAAAGVPPGQVDPSAAPYVAMGLPAEAVLMALASHGGTTQAKVVDFCTAYSQLLEMGFSPESVAGALALYDNDRDRALAHLAGI